jgi:hypothetical protein
MSVTPSVSVVFAAPSATEKVNYFWLLSLLLCTDMMEQSGVHVY